MLNFDSLKYVPNFSDYSMFTCSGVHISALNGSFKGFVIFRTYNTRAPFDVQI